ncbi:MAG TPA: DUF4062 domain-containing protein [Polaromonas sp.]|uniref:DUF4062 domain-containing protein n=1 Tax=Polaromonas sp. TaxID=1869339 RepID=UPI002D2A194E|nr:DUF4062 domain-containing protein [Polaromonas sp.]HYW55452.1 DUF4062 domain-containing protein [Polaromonas sp.]
MTTKKYQIFVSSTYEDLKAERDQVIKAILEMGHIPVGMEMFSAADEEQWQIIKNQIDLIDYYVLVIAHQYGSVTPEGVSYTEKEYHYAQSKGIPVLGFIVDSSALWPGDKVEKDAKKKKALDQFKTKVKGRLIQFWKNSDDLHAKVSISLIKSIVANPRVGWVRADEVADPAVTRELTRLSGENAVLRQKYESLLTKSNESENEVLHVFNVLTKNEIEFRVRKTPKWDEAETKACTLMDVFNWCAPNLISENSNLGISQNIALGAMGTGYFHNHPVGTNIVSGFIADFSALDLIQPSKKNHSVKDKEKYWTLTLLGKQVMRESRRLALEAGVVPSTPPVAEGTISKDDQPD